MNAWKNGFLVFFVFLAKLCWRKTVQRVDPTAPRILVVSTTGLGDTLWATPAIKAIKTTYPHAFLGVLTSKIGAAVLSDNPYIDRLITIGHRCVFQLPSRLRLLRKERFDTILIFHLSQRPVLPLCCLARPAHIIGTEGINKGLDALLTRKLPKKYQHEIQRRLEIVAHVGVHSHDPQLAIYPTSKDLLHAQHLLSSLPAHTPIIALHPGAKDRFKQWPPSSFIALGQQLQQKLGAHLLITGSAEEKPLTAALARALPHSLDLAGHLSIKELAALFSSIDLLITNDTGPMHLAFAMDTKTVALFSSTDPSLCGPLGKKNTKVLYKHKTCTPCLGKKCRDAFCMLQHSPEEVLEHAAYLLEKVPC